MQLHDLVISRHSRRMVLTSPLALFIVLAGCSMVDTAPAGTSPELDVRNYYIQLASPNVEYDYTVASTAPDHPTSGTLAMNMKGIFDSVNGTPVYGCLWNYGTYGTPTNWYYSLSNLQAINLGTETSNWQYTDTW